MNCVCVYSDAYRQYRYEVLANLQTLKFLDASEVTDSERAAAQLRKLCVSVCVLVVSERRERMKRDDNNTTIM